MITNDTRKENQLKNVGKRKSYKMDRFLLNGDLARCMLIQVSFFCPEGEKINSKIKYVAPNIIFEGGRRKVGVLLRVILKPGRK